MTKREAIAKAALKVRVVGRKAGYLTEDMAWDAIAELGDLGGVTLSAQSVIRKAQAELKANGETLKVR